MLCYGVIHQRFQFADVARIGVELQQGDKFLRRAWFLFFEFACRGSQKMIEEQRDIIKPFA